MENLVQQQLHGTNTPSINKNSALRAKQQNLQQQPANAQLTKRAQGGAISRSALGDITNKLKATPVSKNKIGPNHSVKKGAKSSSFQIYEDPVEPTVVQQQQQQEHGVDHDSDWLPPLEYVPKPPAPLHDSDDGNLHFTYWDDELHMFKDSTFSSLDVLGGHEAPAPSIPIHGAVTSPRKKKKEKFVPKLMNDENEDPQLMGGSSPFVFQHPR